MASWFKRGSSAEPANAAAAQGQPLLLIGFNDSTNKWEVGQEALRALKGIAGPLCTISVCGRARQGKSFLLNQMLGKFTGVDKFRGFVVSPTQQSCTRGIWMWSHPVQIPGPDGRRCNTILMDCEGVDAVDQGAQHSAQIFSLAMLLSSIFVYNQVGAIDAIAIERLAMVCELAKRIKNRSTVTGDNNSAAAAAGQVDFSPAFIWLLRDFQLRLEANGKPISPAEYLEEALLPIKATGAADIANKNQMRQTIKAVFPDRDVAVMVRPALTEADLQKLDSLPNASLRPEFRKDMDEFMQVVKSKARPMAVGGTLISGALMAGLAAAYVQAVNEGAVPQLVTAWQGVSRAECQKAFEQAEAQYNNAFQVAGVTEESALYDKHTAAAAAALGSFKRHAMGEPELVKEFEERLTKGFEERYAEERRKLAASGERLATDMLAAEAIKLRGIMTGPRASVEGVETELRRFLDEYDLKVPGGSFKYKKAAEFLMNTIISGIKGIVQDIVTAKEAAASRAAEAEAAVTQLKTEVSRLKDAESRASSTRSELLSAQQEAAHLTGQLESKDRHAAGLESELCALRQQQSHAGAAQVKVQQDLDVAKAEVARLQGQLGAAGRLQGQLDDLRSQLAQAAQRETALQQQKAAAEQEAQHKAAQLATAQQSAERLQQQVTAGQPELEGLRSRVQQLDRELQEAKVAESRASGELEEERKKVTAKMEELAKVSAHNSDLSQQVASLNAELVKEHKGTTAAAKKAYGLRYRLLTYLYGSMYSAHKKGGTLARPIFFNDPSDLKARNANQQWMMGEALMVSPVVTNTTSIITPHFTAGAWYSAWDYSRLDSSGQAVRMDVPLGDIAVHLRGGAIVPMQQYAAVTRDMRWSPVNLVVALPAAAATTAASTAAAGPVLPYALDQQCAQAREQNTDKLVSCGLLYADDDAPEASDANSLQAWFTALTDKDGDSGTISSTVTAAAPQLSDRLRITQIEVIGLAKQLQAGSGGSSGTSKASQPHTTARTSMEAWRSDKPAVSVSGPSLNQGSAAAEYDGSRGVLKITGLNLLASEPFSINWRMA